jgi:D-arabinose 5-phosphate isomerase GutQ
VILQPGSTSRPGGNLTGIAYLNVEVAGKRFELLHKLVPDAKSVAFLVQRDILSNQLMRRRHHSFGDAPVEWSANMRCWAPVATQST